MGDLILGSIVDSITGHVFSLISQEIRLACGVKGELKKLQTTVSIIEALLREADKRHVKSEVVRVWLRELQDVVYDVDDLLDDLSSEVLLRRSAKGKGKRILNEVRTFFSSSNQIIYASRVAHRVKEVRERIDVITNDEVHFQLGASTGGILGSLVENRVRPETIPFESKPYVIGRDEDKKKVIELLLNPQNEESVSVLPIVGIGGIGKTTLARLVFNDESVKEYFELKLWVCVSTNFNVEDILRKIVRECKQELANVSMNELQKKLGEELRSKRFLLVLDDVWNENRDKWLDLQGFVMNGAKGSKILVTTRSPRVAKTMAKTFHELSGLPEDESLSLLMQAAMKNEDEWRNHNLEIIAREILKKCVGVPLAIMTMGRLLLFTRNTEEDWLNFKSNDLSRIDQDEGDIMPSLKLSYDFLPSHLKQCFAYCSLIPKDYELDPSELINLWMAQGFIKSPGNRKTLEEVGQEYFMELVSRSFFQEFEENLLGNIKKCKMHDLMHDLAMLVAGDNCITIDGSPTLEITGRARHVFMVNMEDYELERPGMERIRSMLFLGRYDDNSKTEIPRLELSRFRNLRALCIGSTNIESLPDSIGKLKHMRSLDLACNSKLRSLPNSIGMLCNLESLDLNYCFDLERIPRGITKLVNLRRLNVSGCTSLTHMPRGIGKLTSLQTLSDFFVGENGDSNAESLNELSRLTRLGKKLRVQYLNRLGTNISRELDASFSIDKLALQSLELNWGYEREYDRENRANDEKISERLRPHPDLKKLTIYGCGGTRLSSWISQLQKLVVINIYGCECKYLLPLDHLPCLKRISLGGLHNLELIELSESVTQQQSLFPSLQELHLNGLSEFKGWKWRGNANRIEGGEEDIQDEGMKGSSFLSTLPHFSDKVKITVSRCPRFSYMDQQVLQLSGNIMKNWQQLWENVASQAPHSPNPNLLMAKPHPSTMTFVSISSIPLFAPALTSLVICNFEDREKLLLELLRSFPSLKSLVIEHCSCLKSLPWKAMLRYLTALETLKISWCKELDLSIEDDDGDDVTDEHVHDLQLHGHCKLRDLTINKIDKMESLPRWIQHLTNLERLSLGECNRLESLPGWLCQLTSLKHLEIFNCGEPPRRDWPNIPPHIHDVHIYP